MDDINNTPDYQETPEVETSSQPAFVMPESQAQNIMPQTSPKKKLDGLGLAAMICGIIGTAGASLAPAVVGLILGCVAKPDCETGKKTTFAKLGIIFGAIGIVLGIISLIISVFWAEYLYEMFGDIFSSGSFDIDSFSNGNGGSWT
ncbi:MAG: DUF4190 domain-containing protein [Ruminococcaceae bacterium]|nr:DUF4190 domain-containing protein [Oscillospiraceae bacterium]